jgi:hypothetical protein
MQDTVGNYDAWQGVVSVFCALWYLFCDTMLTCNFKIATFFDMKKKNEPEYARLSNF